MPKSSSPEQPSRRLIQTSSCALTQIPQEYDLAIIEDAAPALPAKYKGRFIGSANPKSEIDLFLLLRHQKPRHRRRQHAHRLARIYRRSTVWSLHGMSRDAWKRYSAEGRGTTR